VNGSLAAAEKSSASAPVIDRSVTSRGPVPLLATVTAWVVESPAVTVPKSTADGPLATAGSGSPANVVLVASWSPGQKSPLDGGLDGLARRQRAGLTSKRAAGEPTGRPGYGNALESNLPRHVDGERDLSSGVGAAVGQRGRVPDGATVVGSGNFEVDDEVDVAGVAGVPDPVVGLAE